MDHLQGQNARCGDPSGLQRTGRRDRALCRLFRRHPAASASPRGIACTAVREEPQGARDGWSDGCRVSRKQTHH